MIPDFSGLFRGETTRIPASKNRVHGISTGGITAKSKSLKNGSIMISMGKESC
jgi:hypothetical protein